jgi:hypothetical protein
MLGQLSAQPRRARRLCGLEDITEPGAAATAHNEKLNPVASECVSSQLSAVATAPGSVILLYRRARGGCAGS